MICVWHILGYLGTFSAIWGMPDDDGPAKMPATASLIEMQTATV
jgi:hypothetical protein